MKGTAGAGKFGPSLRREIFVGCFIHPSELWSKDYLVIDLESFKGSPRGRFALVLRAEKIAVHGGAAELPARMYATEDQAELYHGTQAGDQTSLECDGRPSAEPAGTIGMLEAEGRGSREEVAGQSVTHLPPYHPGQWVDVDGTDASRLRPVYHIQDARVTRIRECNRPPKCMLEVWAMLTPRQRKAWIEEAHKQSRSSDGSWSGPNGPADRGRPRPQTAGA